MFRIAALSLALTFGVAPHATLLCGIWCHPSEATDVCHPHQPTPSAIVSGETTCTDVMADASTFIRADGWTAAASEPGLSVVVRHSPFGLMPTDARTIDSWERVRAIDARPLNTVLRI